MEFSNGDRYCGEFKNSELTGYGCYTLEGGTKIIGYFIDGVCDKHGRKIYPDGTVYLGMFNKDVENGKGILTFKDGR